MDLSYTAKTAFNPADKTLWDFYDHEGEWGEMKWDLDWETAIAYLVEHAPGYNSATMYYNSYYYEKSHNGYVIKYYDGSQYLYIDWPVLDALFVDVIAHPMNYDQSWNTGIWVTDAQTFLTTNASDYSSLDDLFYDSSLGKAFLNYHGSSTTHQIEWPGALSYLQTYSAIDFANDNVSVNVSKNNSYMQVTGVQGSSDIAFSMKYLFENESVGIRHYPKPDSNPDNDNPVDWSNDPHIVTRDNGNTLVFYGYGTKAFKDFMLSKSDTSDRKEITFDLDEDGVNSHSMQGGGFLFNIKTEDDGTGKLLMSGYAILFESSGIGLYQIDHVNVNSFHEEKSYRLGSMTGVSLLKTFTKDANSLHSVKIIIENNVLNFYDNGFQKIKDYALPEVYGNRFGPLAAYSSHNCSQLSYFTLSNLKMSTVSTVVKTIDQVVDEITWDSAAKHYLINLEENIDGGLDAAKISAIGTKLKAASAAYLAVGSTTNKDQQQALISANGSLGLFIPQTDSDIIDQIAAYIFTKVHPIIIPNIVDLEIVKLGKPYTLKAGDTSSTVTGDVTFLNPLVSYTGSTVKWTSSKPANLSNSGIVVQPSFTNGDVEVVASMEVTFEDITIKKEYPFTIKKLPITAPEKLAMDTASLSIVYASGDSADSVTSNLGFIATLPQGSTVVWSTNKPNVISVSGVVNRSTFTIGDQAVLITAVLSNGSETQTKTFNVRVKKLPASSSEKLALDMPSLAIIYAEGDSDKSVTKDLGFSASLPQGSTVLWSTDKPTIIKETGNVIRPTFTIGDQAVLITAVVTNGSATQTQTFNVNVVKNVKSGLEKAEEDGKGIIDYAVGEDETNVKTIVEMAKNGVNGSTITWTSSHPDILTENGIVSRPKKGDVEVTLTATIKNGDASIVKTFKVMVKQDETPKSSLNDYLLYLLIFGVLAGSAWWFIIAKKKKKEVEE